MGKYVIIVQYFHKESTVHRLETTESFAKEKLKSEIRKAERGNSGVAYVIMNSVVQWSAKDL